MSLMNYRKLITHNYDRQSFYKLSITTLKAATASQICLVVVVLVSLIMRLASCLAASIFAPTIAH